MKPRIEKTESQIGNSALVPVDGLTIGQVLRRTAELYPNQTAAVFCSINWRATWRELDEQVDLCARGLLALGFHRGDHLGVWSTNIPQWVMLQLATARIGVVLVTINPAYRASELAFVIKHADLKGIAVIDRFKSTDYRQLIREVIPEMASSHAGPLQLANFPKLQWVISLRGQPSSPARSARVAVDLPGRPATGVADLPGAMDWQELLNRAEGITSEHVKQREAELNCHDPVNIQFTSGTTGMPKGAMLSHRNLLLNAYYAGDNQRLTQQDRLAIPVPLYHCFGCVLGSLCCVVHGTTMVFPSEGFQADATLQAIQAEQCSAVYGVPTMFIAMLDHPDYASTRLDSLRTGIMAGSPCPIELMKRVTSEMGASQMTIGYGQTEASPLITQTTVDDSIELRVGTIGRPIAGVEVKIVDSTTGQSLPDSVSGELCTRGHHVMLGYYNEPDKTAAAIDAEGWLHTGDLAMREPNGYYRITGRLKDLIIRGGENVYPREVEEVLYTHSAVSDVQVIGVPDRKFGEEIMAWVSLRAGATVTEEQLRQFCNSRMAYFKVPKYWKFVESFPTTVTGKIQKFKMREISIQELGLQDAASIRTA